MESAYDDERGGIDRPAPDEIQQNADSEPVLRMEFYGQAGPLDVKPDGHRAPPAPAPSADVAPAPAERTHQSGPFDTNLHARDEALEKRAGILAALEAEAMGRDAALSRREQMLAGSEGLFEAESADVERREWRLAQIESRIAPPIDERELTVEQRESELEAAFSLREDRIEHREAELAELEARLARKEQDLASYVGPGSGRVRPPRLISAHLPRCPRLSVATEPRNVKSR